MPQSGLYGFPTDAIVLNQIFDSGSGRFQKPQGLNGKHTVIVKAWAGGAGGAVTPAAGAGGGFNQRAFPYEDFPASCEWVVGVGGAANTAGGDSYVAGTGVDVAATGGKASGGSYACGKPAFRYGTSTCYEFDFAPYNGGTGGAPGSLVLASAIWGGAAGVATATATGPKSIHGGNGSGNDGSNIAPAAPGGGGTTYYNSGQAADGRVQFIIVRGIVPDMMGNLF